ncbi:MAG TPA: Ku protein [Bryobacteraceae bacterium]|nr:Ku protein [Bryobacteraceae bacterium]
MAAIVWSGHITFGLVSFPVELAAAARRIVMDFDLLHRADGSPVKYVTYCKAEDRALEKSEIVKGFAYEKGKYVLLEAEDFAKAAPGSAKVMEIQQFVAASEMDLNLLDASYFVKPKDAGARPYALLYETLRRLDRWGIAQMAMHNREHLVAIRPGEKGLVLHTLFYEEELRTGEQSPAEPSGFRKKEHELAASLVETLTAPLDLSQYHDGYRERLTAVIEAKKRGKKVVAVRETKRAPVVDIMEALRQSIAAGKSKARAPRKTAAQSAPKTGRGRRAS